jgi:replicative DNA helicase
MVQTLDDTRRSARAAPSRVPPHNLPAEESVLGAMLLSRDAIAGALEICDSEHFYKPAHTHVFEAIKSLYAQGEPADPITVADELRRADLLDAIGGHTTLIDLQAATPSTANAAHYARIVEEHALLRRLIGVASEMAEIGYSVPEDVEAAIDRAESMVFEVADRRVTETLKPLRDLLGDSLDRIEALYGRGQSITGVPTGFMDLDERLSGLQKSSLVIVGARPAMGKALALDTPIPTPAGWTTMGEITAGMSVLDARGRPCTVTWASPVQHERRCYRVEFDDGSSIVADADHQWFSYDFPAWKSARERHRRLANGPPGHPGLARDKRAWWKQPRVVTTAQMLSEGVRLNDGRPNWYFPLCGALDLPDRSVPADPYVLGCWLGDGSTTSSELTIGSQDTNHFRSAFAAAGYALEARSPIQDATVPASKSEAEQDFRGPYRQLTRELQELGLLGDQSKRIPSLYLRASFKQRLALLQGILDTGGGVTNRNGTVELCLADRDLLAQARELICSLGHKPGPIRQRTFKLRGVRQPRTWRMAWTPLDPVFRLRRKADQLEASRSHRAFGKMTRRAITAIVPVDPVPVRCITVDSPYRLYLCGESMVPTHNTSFALGIAAHAAMEARIPVLFFSLEMSHAELTQRLLCAEARVDSTRVRTGRLLESDWSKISHAIGRLGEAPLFIDDNPNLTVMDIRGKARRLKAAQGGLGLIVVDYLQLMSGRQTAENRQVEISEISRGLKILARELEVPVLALSQLSRNLEMRADKRPMLADLRESGSLEQDSDVVMFIYRDEIYNRESAEKGTAEIIVAKHRNGPTGSTSLAFLDHVTRFVNMARM